MANPDVEQMVLNEVFRLKRKLEAMGFRDQNLILQLMNREGALRLAMGLPSKGIFSL